MRNEPVTADKVTIESTMEYKNTPVLHYKIEYPVFHHSHLQPILDYINHWYQSMAMGLQKNYETVLYQSAIDLYNDTTNNHFPFHMYEAVSQYEIPYNQNSMISLYFDHYIYSGGAHGNTERRSETWDISNGQRISLFQYAKDPADYQAEILNNIQKQIAHQIELGEGMYFDEYPQLIYQYFDPESFYLTPEGITIYYQQYEIAPYASGIPSFLISQPPL